MSQQPKFSGDDLTSLVIAEILLVKESLETIPGTGPGVRISDDLVLIKSTRKLYKVVQGEWIESDSLPLVDYLKILKKSLANRTHLVKNRIRKLTQTLTELEAMFNACDDPKKLEELLRRAAHLREVSARDRR